LGSGGIEARATARTGFKPMLCFAAITNALHRKAQRSRLTVERGDQFFYFPEELFVVGINDKGIDICRSDEGALTAKDAGTDSCN